MISTLHRWTGGDLGGGHDSPIVYGYVWLRLFYANPTILAGRCDAYTIRVAVFDWDRNNLRKIKAHDVTAAEVTQALSGDPILIYEQDADGEIRHVYYGETERNRLLAVVLTERNQRIRVITAYDLDAGQKRDYRERRTQGE
jgi:uncharacterized DUF497 family protein